MKLSIIIPFVGEWAQIVFTLRAVAELAQDACDFEVIAVDNWCHDVEAQGRTPDRGHAHVDKDGKKHPSHIQTMAAKNSWLKYVHYEEKLSHWNAKRAGVEASTGDWLLFLDAHVVPSRRAIERQAYWFERLLETHGEKTTLHLPLTYHILETHRLVYRLVDERATGNVAYSFCGYHETEEPYEVACMSTCGMMITRRFYDQIGGWPIELGIYSGGEHYMNFAGAICGLRKFITPGVTLHHHGEKRGYHWNYDDSVRNRAIACYLFGGEEYLDRWLAHKKGRPQVLEFIGRNVLASCAEHRKLIEAQQVTTIDDWLDEWTRREPQPTLTT